MCFELKALASVTETSVVEGHTYSLSEMNPFTGEFSGVDEQITDLLSELQSEVSSEANHKSSGDDELSETADSETQVATHSSKLEASGSTSRVPDGEVAELPVDFCASPAQLVSADVRRGLTTKERAKVRVWESEDLASDTRRVLPDIPGGHRMCGTYGHDDTRSHARVKTWHRAKQQGANEQGRRLGKQVWMIMEGKSRPLDVEVEEEGEEIAERWCKMNGMNDCDIRLMAEGRIIGWNQLVDLGDGAMVTFGEEWGRRARRTLRSQTRDRRREVVRRKNNLRSWTQRNLWKTTVRLWAMGTSTGRQKWPRKKLRQC